MPHPIILVQDLVPCILVSFDKEQIIVWRGKDCDGILQDQMQKSFPVIDSDGASVKSESDDQEQATSDCSSDECSAISSNEEPDDKPVISNLDSSMPI
jgi:hypothetical protein